MWPWIKSKILEPVAYFFSHQVPLFFFRLFRSIRNLFITDQQLPTDRQDYHEAVKSGSVEKLEQIETRAAFGQIQQMIQADSYMAYRWAAQEGHVAVLKHLEEKAPNLIQQMIEVNNYEAYCRAAQKGHVAVLKHLEEKAPLLTQRVIKVYNYQAYHSAAWNGHLAVLQYLEEKAPHLIQQMIQDENYYAYRQAAVNGHLAVLQHLEAKAPDQIQQMIRADYYIAYCGAAENGHLAVLQHLEAKAPDQVQQMTQPYCYVVYRGAAENGHLAVLQHLEAKAPNLIQQMIQLGYSAFYSRAAENGHLAVLQHLEAKAPDQIQQMIRAENYMAYHRAAWNGHLAVLQYLEAKAPNLIQQMIQADNYKVYRRAAQANNYSVVNHLLSFPTCFAYAEMHEQEYGERYIHPFVAEQLAQLRSQQQVVESANPQAVFDLADPEKAKLCFYIIRNLIRRSDRALDDDLRFLINIPSVKELLHTAVTPNEENELLRLAIHTNNREAAGLLLNIPAVRQLAERNGYYQAESRNGLDLRALAQDRESSMRALTSGEQKRLEAVIKHYQPMVQAAGVNHLMSDLKNTLLERYDANPAMVTVDDQGIALPAEGDAFQALNLTAAAREQALTAYYQHPDHTAWRYLSKPNYWMNERASYVNIDTATGERWSTFEEYQPLIAMLYLAAIDKEVPAIDGHTYEGRVNHFINELAYIGRAHNWDDTRINAQGKREEYDDLTGDKPSCYSGVKRRLFQSIIGHPLMKSLMEKVIWELQSFVHAHFKTLINDSNRSTLKAAMDTFANEIDYEAEALAAPLKELDISSKQIKQFLEELSNKYGDEFKKDMSFTRYVTDTLSFTNGVIPESQQSHLSKLYDFANLKVLLAPQPINANVSTVGLFAVQRAEASESVSSNSLTASTGSNTPRL